MLLDCNETKQQILEEFLKICVFDGWNKDALLKAISNCKIDPKFAELIFENDCLDLAEFFVEVQNKKALEKILEIEDFSNKKVRDKIRLALYARFEVEKNHQIILQRLINFYLNLKNFTSLEIGVRPTIKGIKSIYKISDFIWKSIDDKSTDFNFYTKRLTLSKIILRSLLFFIKDESLDFIKTKNLIDLEIEKVMKFEKKKQQVKKALNISKKAFDEVFFDEKGAPKSAKEIIKSLPFIRLIKF
jgi:ubiquinone biosynthesis protein COQ9